MARPVVDTPTTMTPIPPPILLKVQSRPQKRTCCCTPSTVITTGQPTVRPANEALRILETHRNQTKDETNDLRTKPKQNNNQRKPTGDCN